MMNSNPSHPTGAENKTGTSAQQAVICCPPGVCEVTITIRFSPVSQASASGSGTEGAAVGNRQEKKPRRRFDWVPDLDTLLEGSSFNRPE